MLKALGRILIFLADLLDDPEIKALIRKALAARLRANIRRDDGQAKLDQALGEGDGAGVESSFDFELLPEAAFGGGDSELEAK